MVYKNSLLVISLCLLTACVGSKGNNNIYKNGYQAGVKEEVQHVSDNFQSGSFPYYHWSAPIVQDLSVPASISNGVFIPAHKELVLIKPGEWAKNGAYEISTNKESYEKIEQNNSNDVADITSVP